MKDVLLCVLGLSFFGLSAQYTDLAPWADRNSKTSLNQQVFKEEAGNFQKLVKQFDRYWNTRDPTTKGSGYKPFMRWRNKWENALTAEGNVPTTAQIEQRFLKSNELPNLKGSNWSTVGPADPSKLVKGGRGRINYVVVDPNNPNTIYAGAPAGGLWKSTNQGDSWIPLFQDFEQIGVSAIAIDPNNSNTIYIGTGDEPRSSSYSIGIMKSTNGGLTWTKTGFQFSGNYGSIKEVMIHPTNSNILWAATSEGFFKSTNAGNSWVKKLQTHSWTNSILHPTNPNIIYTIINDSNYALSFYKSIDGGENFYRTGTGLPKVEKTYRMAFDVTPANPNIIYAFIPNDAFVLNGEDQDIKGVYKSINGGESFTRTASINIGSGTMAEIAVSDTNEQVVFIGDVHLNRSTDGGSTFINDYVAGAPRRWGVHVDFHYLKYFNNTLYCGTDGGVFTSRDNLSFEDKNGNMEIGEFYYLSVPENGSSNHIVGGLQDNGTRGFDGSSWNMFSGGDGTGCVVLPNKNNVFFGFNQFGSVLNLSLDYGQSRRFSMFSRPVRSPHFVRVPLRANSSGELFAFFNSFYKLHPSDWENLSSDVVYLESLWEKQTDFFDKINISIPDVLEIDPINENIIYAARSRTVFKSIDKGKNWIEISTPLTFPSIITSIEVDNNENNVVYISCSDKIIKSNDGGNNYQDITGNLRGLGSLNIIKHQKDTDFLYVGGQFGVYVYDGNKWNNFNKSLPSVTISDLALNYTDKVVIASTFGRGIWKSPLLSVSCADDDNDGVCNEEDNCPNIANSNQTDSNNNGFGDACETPEGFDLATTLIYDADAYPLSVGCETTIVLSLAELNNSVPDSFSLYIRKNASFEITINPTMDSVVINGITHATDNEFWNIREYSTVYNLTSTQNLKAGQNTNIAITLRAKSVAKTNLRAWFYSRTDSNSGNNWSVFNFEIDSKACSIQSNCITDLPYQQSFENGLEDWVQDTDDDFDWTYKSGDASPFGTGPDSAFEGNYYLYLRTYYPNYPYKTAVLTSPCFYLNSNSYVAQFAYHMYGRYIGSLALEVSTDDGVSWTAIWEKSGAQGSIWKTASINLSAYANTEISLRFKGVSGGSTSGFTAIDNFALVSLNTNFNARIAISSEGETAAKEQVVLSPNPTFSILNVESTGAKIITYTIHDTNGKLIQKNTPFTNPISVETLSNGLYYLNLIFEDNSKITKSFVKQ